MTSPVRAIPFGPQTVAELTTRYADPDAEALVGRASRYTYRGLDAAIAAAAAALWKRGLRPGDRLAVSAPSDCDLVIAFFAAQRLGLVWVGMNRALASAEKAFLIHDAGARLFLGDVDMVAQLKGHNLPADFATIAVEDDGPDGWSALVRAGAGASNPSVTIDPFAPAAIAYTSGTTGRPKGAVHSQHNMMAFPLAGLHSGWGGTWSSKVRRTASIPLTILNAMIFGPLGSLAGGGAYICLDRLDALSVADAIEKHRIDALLATPTTIFDLLHRAELNGRRLSSLKYASAGGSFVAEELKTAFRQRYGSELIEEYGLTESPCAIAGGRFDQHAAPGSVGRAYPHIEVAALGPDGAVLGAGEVGEICSRAVKSGVWAGVYAPMLGYWEKPEETREALEHGWLHTGDLGRLDSEGRVFIVGRKKEIIVRGGANVYPAEIERVLKTHPRITDAVVLGLPHDRLGEMAAAFLLLNEKAGQDSALRGELVELCGTQLARYKTPEKWFVVSDIPRNAMNKPDRKLLREVPRTELS